MEIVLSSFSLPLPEWFAINGWKESVDTSRKSAESWYDLLIKYSPFLLRNRWLGDYSSGLSSVQTISNPRLSFIHFSICSIVVCIYSSPKLSLIDIITTLSKNGTLLNRRSRSCSLFSSISKRYFKQFPTSDNKPVSYTHLTLPTTPYV